jgi:hypothetical protein
MVSEALRGDSLSSPKGRSAGTFQFILSRVMVAEFLGNR